MEQLDALTFFAGKPEEFKLFEAFDRLLHQQFSDLSVKVQKTQISYYNRHLFACLSLPRNHFHNRPEHAILVTLGLSRPLDSPRVAYLVEPYPGRWTHHLLIGQEFEFDKELIGWVREAYDFSASK